jgi:hypothetical protein
LCFRLAVRITQVAKKSWDIDSGAEDEEDDDQEAAALSAETGGMNAAGAATPMAMPGFMVVLTCDICEKKSEVFTYEPKVSQ